MPRRTATDDESAAGIVMSLANLQSTHAVDEGQLLNAVRCVLEDAGISSGEISLAVVGDTAIQELNDRYLGHDRPTDVLSFVLQKDDGRLDGEIVLSAETAATSAAEIGWPAACEQLLYAIHGALHLVGYDDATPAQRRRIRQVEAKYLRHFGIEPVCAGAGC